MKALYHRVQKTVLFAHFITDFNGNLQNRQFDIGKGEYIFKRGNLLVQLIKHSVIGLIFLQPVSLLSVVATKRH